jgi:serine/threonine protein phosphatase PrpC
MSTKPGSSTETVGGSFFDFCSRTRKVPEESEKGFFDSITDFFGMGCTSRRGIVSIFSKDRIAPEEGEKLMKNLFKALTEKGTLRINPSDFDRHVRTEMTKRTNGVICRECFIFKEFNRTELRQIDQRIDPTNPITAFTLFEGINGREVAEFLQSRCQVVLKALVSQGHSPKEVLLRTFHELEANVLSNRTFTQQGAGGIVCLIDHENALIYTATLGNSRAYIIQKGNKGGAIPLSNIRNFSSKKDIQRLDRALKALKEQRGTCYLPFSGEYRWPNAKEGVPHSRALGLLSYNAYRGLDRPLWPISAKPKITCYPLHGKETLVMGTKPFFDSYPIELFEEAIESNSKSDLQNVIVKAMPLGKEIKEFSGVVLANFQEKRG